MIELADSPNAYLAAGGRSSYAAPGHGDEGGTQSGSRIAESFQERPSLVKTIPMSSDC